MTAFRAGVLCGAAFWLWVTAGGPLCVDVDEYENEVKS